MTASPSAFRQEEDLLGAKDVPAEALYGIHTVRALENFPCPAGRCIADWFMPTAP